MTCWLEGQKEVMLKIALCGGLATKTSLLPLALKTSLILGERRYLSTLLKQMSDDDNDRSLYTCNGFVNYYNTSKKIFKYIKL